MGLLRVGREVREEVIRDHLMDAFPAANIPDIDIPDDLQEFYDDLGKPFFHSLSREQIERLAPLQAEFWKHHRQFKRLIILKSQKIGISSICILITLWHALKDCRGMELIINAQSDEQAKTHAQDLRRIIMNSEKYRKYLITKQFTEIGLLKDEQTKIHQIWIHNPSDPRHPTKIIVAGMSPGALLSHKRVGFVWSSDMTISDKTPQKQYEVWGAMLSRLANSQGPCIIECPTRAPTGPVFDADERYLKQIENGDKIDMENDFHVFRYTYELGIRDGFFTMDFIEAEKRRLGPLFGAFYMANWFASGSTWYKPEHFRNTSVDAAELILRLKGGDDDLSDLTDD